MYANDDFNDVIFSDEVIFYLRGKVVKMWCKKEDDDFYQEETFNPYNKEKLHIWGAICKKGAFPLYFHDSKKGVNSESYI
jgi:hypothetical protein